MRRERTSLLSCRVVRRDVQAYLDHESPPGRDWQVARHLAACEDCYADAESWRRLTAAVAGLRMAPDPGALARLRRVVQALDG